MLGYFQIDAKGTRDDADDQRRGARAVGAGATRRQPRVPRSRSCATALVELRAGRRDGRSSPTVAPKRRPRNAARPQTAAVDRTQRAADAGHRRSTRAATRRTAELERRCYWQQRATSRARTQSAAASRRRKPPQSRRRRSRDAPPAPTPVTITVSPLEWRTLPFAGVPALVAVRQVADARRRRSRRASSSIARR